MQLGLFDTADDTPARPTPRPTRKPRHEQLTLFVPADTPAGQFPGQINALDLIPSKPEPDQVLADTLHRGDTVLTNAGHRLGVVSHITRHPADHAATGRIEVTYGRPSGAWSKLYDRDAIVWAIRAEVDHQRGTVTLPYDTAGMGKTGDVVPAWVCCQCGGVEITKYTLELNHGCCRSFNPWCRHRKPDAKYPYNFRPYWTE